MSGWDCDYRYEPSPLFQKVFTCLPFDYYKNPELETGNKIIMPPSSLAHLIDRRVRSPFFFKVESFNNDKTSHCSVLEFGAEEGYVYMPWWMMKNLGVEEGDDVSLRDAVLSTGNYMKLPPHTTSFIEISNVKAVLEMALRGFSCLSAGDTIMIRLSGEEFYLDVLEVGPGGEAISLIDTDCTTEFAPPLDYVEPTVAKDEEMGEEVEEVVKKAFEPFVGVGRRLDGTVVKVEKGGSSAAAAVEKEKKKKKEEDGGKEFKHFSGTGRFVGGPSFFDF